MNQLPAEDVLFLQEKRILSIVEGLLSSLVLSDTKMPTRFLIDCLRPKSLVDKIVFDLTSIDFRSDAFLPRLRKAYECLLNRECTMEYGPFAPLKSIIRTLLKDTIGSTWFINALTNCERFVPFSKFRKIILTTLIYKDKTEVLAESSKLFTKVTRFSEKKILSLSNKRKFLIAVLAVFPDALSHTWQEHSSLPEIFSQIHPKKLQNVYVPGRLTRDEFLNSISKLFIAKINFEPDMQKKVVEDDDDDNDG